MARVNSGVLRAYSEWSQANASDVLREVRHSKPGEKEGQGGLDGAKKRQVSRPAASRARQTRRCGTRVAMRPRLDRCGELAPVSDGVGAVEACYSFLVCQVKAHDLCGLAQQRRWSSSETSE